MASADSVRSRPSKIPRYIKSHVPVCSSGHKEVLKLVTEKRKEIEKVECEVKCLKEDLKEVTRPSLTLASSKNDDQRDASTFKTPQVETTTSPSRTSVVKLTHIKLKTDLKDALCEVIEVKTGALLKVDDLILKLQERFPGIKGFERVNILRTISQLYGRKLEYRGRKKEGYYKGLSLKCPNEKEECPRRESTSSPHHKVRRGLLQSERSGGEDDIEDITQPDVEDKIHNLTLGADAKDCEENLSQRFTHVQESLVKLKKDLDGALVEQENLTEKLASIEKSFRSYEEFAEKIMGKQDYVITLYKDIVATGNLLGGLLSLSERNEIKTEVKKAKEMFKLNLRNKEVTDLIGVFDPCLFQRLVSRMRSECPTISNMIEQLVISSNAYKNTKKTINMKMKAGIHLLASLLDIRDQQSGNDVPVLFGLLCLCYGAGPSMIKVLQHLGLSESFPILTGILKQQLVHYKVLISKRVGDNIPVITYQDNMQLKRTSLRHLRLSKLQKEKIKQGKMWDFTVRGWRVSDISGIEDLFQEPMTTTKPQRDVQAMKYEDTKIECNQEHNQRWQYFKERNVLRKLNLGLNCVTMSSEELVNSSIEHLQLQSTAAGAPQAAFKINIPDVDEEYPDLGKKKKQIFPLPISHENQCTTVGVASNLELFTEEFGFSCVRNKKYLPLKRSGKEFDLERAYQRYAFLKALEQHKEQQHEYEQILRGQESDVESVEADNVDVVLFDGNESDNEQEVHDEQ